MTLAENIVFMTVAHFAPSEIAQNVQDLRSCILEAPGFCRNERPKRAQMNLCPVGRGEMLK